MASTNLHGMFDIQSVPAPTYQKGNGKQPHVGVLPDIELEPIRAGKDSNNASYFDQPKTGTQTPKTPNDLEASCPPTPRNDDAVGLVQTWNNPPMNKWRILCCCVIYFGNGLNDAGESSSIQYSKSEKY
jgi:hypothetical protein